MTAVSGVRTVGEVKGHTMDIRRLARPLLLGAVIVSGCGDDNDRSTSESPVTTTGATVTTNAPSTAPASPTTTPSAPAALLFEDAFDDDRNGWGVVDHPDYGSMSYEGGDYVWAFAGSVAHWLPKVLGDQYDQGELDMADVVVHAEATVLKGGGVIGVFCREQPDDDADWEWYEFVARDGFAAIRQADSEGNIDVLAETEHVTAPAGQPLSIEATCSDDNAGHAQLSLSLNDAPLLTATGDDPLGHGPPGLQAWTYPKHDQMDIRWHEFSIHALDI